MNSLSDNSDVMINAATLDDISFIVDTIVAAEKSGTDHFGLARMFGLDESTMKRYLAIMLEEEIDGCELSVSSFLVARYNGKPVAAFAGWIEGENEENKPSSFLKSSLLTCVLPSECMLHVQQNKDLVKPFQIEREKGAYQLEYSYTLPEYRRRNLMMAIVNEHVKHALSAGTKKIQVHVFANNDSAIRTYSKCGFCIKQSYSSESPLIDTFYPYNTLLLMEKEIY